MFDVKLPEDDRKNVETRGVFVNSMWKCTS